ncbi:MAG TPA: TolC family protein [Polyangiaceae bacterium]|jgi:outer membrane protein TolC|nr:TolC family protein [Polyangiaceae bacterium]
MMKNRTVLPLLCLSFGLLDASVASAQATPAAPGAGATAPKPPTAVTTPAPARPAPPGPAAGGDLLRRPGAPAVPGGQPGAPTTVPPPVPSGAGVDPLSGVTSRELPSNTPSPRLEGLDAQPGGLTANDVARRAVDVSPSVRQKREQVKSANERIYQTTVSFLPKLTLLASYTRTSKVNVSFGSGGGTLVGTQLKKGDTITSLSQIAPVGLDFPFPLNNYALEGRLSIPISDYVLRVSDASGATKASRGSARLEVAAEKLKVASDARALYFNWLRSWAQVSIAKNTVESTRARLADARATFQVGAISKADLLRIEALVANTENILNQSVSTLNLTTGELAIVMEDWRPNYRIGEEIPDPATIHDADASTDKLIAEGLARRLEVRSLDEAVRALSYGAKAARAGALPHIDAIGDVLYANPNARYFPPSADWHTSWSIGAQASWTFGDTLSNESQGRDYDAQAQAMIAQRRLVRAGVAQEVLASSLDLSRARVSLDKQRVALAAAQEAYRVTTDLFRAGRATGTDLIQSEQGLLDAQVGEVNARIDLAIAAIALRHALGRDVGEVKIADED